MCTVREYCFVIYKYIPSERLTTSVIAMFYFIYILYTGSAYHTLLLPLTQADDVSRAIHFHIFQIILSTHHLKRYSHYEMYYFTEPILGLLPGQRAVISLSSLNISMKTYCRKVFAALLYKLQLSFTSLLVRLRSVFKPYSISKYST